MATDVFPAVPADDHTFALSRRRDTGAAVALVLVGVWVSCGVIGGLSYGHGAGRYVFVACWVILYVALFLQLARPIGTRPVAVRVTASSVQVQWRNRQVEHLWDGLTWGQRFLGGPEIVDGDGWTGVSLDLLDPRERPRFSEMFLSHLPLPGAESEAAALADGAAITASAARRGRLVQAIGALILAMPLAFWLTLRFAPTDQFLHWYLPVLLGSHAVRNALDLRRAMVRTVRFTPEGLVVETRPRRSKLHDYQFIGSIVCAGTGPRRLLRVSEGPLRPVLLYAEDEAFDGALHLLRERATYARWDIRS